MQLIHFIILNNFIYTQKLITFYSQMERKSLIGTALLRPSYGTLCRTPSLLASNSNSNRPTYASEDILHYLGIFRMWVPAIGLVTLTLTTRYDEKLILRKTKKGRNKSFRTRYVII